MGVPKYVDEFIKEVYPEMTELCMTVNTEAQCLVDATELIRELRETRDRLRLENEALKDKLMAAVESTAYFKREAARWDDWAQGINEAVKKGKRQTTPEGGDA